MFVKTKNYEIITSSNIRSAFVITSTFVAPPSFLSIFCFALKGISEALCILDQSYPAARLNHCEWLFYDIICKQITAVCLQKKLVIVLFGLFNYVISFSVNNCFAIQWQSSFGASPIFFSIFQFTAKLVFVTIFILNSMKFSLRIDNCSKALKRFEQI